MFAWWTGRGYLAMLTTIGTVGVFGAIVTFGLGDEIFEHQPWLWGIAYALAAGVNWWVGSRINGRLLRLSRFTNLKHRFFYDARNRFCGLPIETWSVPLLALGVLLGGLGLVAAIAGKPWY